MKSYNLKHGESGKKATKEYRAWANAIARCFIKTDRQYCDYGGRGITVCNRWRHSYPNFLTDMGRAPSTTYSIDRINNNGNYEPTNCRWATKKEQTNNRRDFIHPDNNGIKYEHEGDFFNIKQLAKKFGMDYPTLHNRLRAQNKTLQEVIDFEFEGINPIRNGRRLFNPHHEKT